MSVLLWILVFLATFCTMEFMAWFTHKYIMHGFLWVLHKDHHHKYKDSGHYYQEPVSVNMLFDASNWESSSSSGKVDCSPVGRLHIVETSIE